jgi:hypothetical protein
LFNDRKGSQQQSTASRKNVLDLESDGFFHNNKPDLLESHLMDEFNAWWTIGGVVAAGAVIFLLIDMQHHDNQFFWQRMSNGWTPKPLTPSQIAGVKAASEANPAILLPYHILHPKSFDGYDDES